MSIVWHREPAMIEHAHATEDERDRCTAEYAEMRLAREAALADLFSDQMEAAR